MSPFRLLCVLIPVLALVHPTRGGAFWTAARRRPGAPRDVDVDKLATQPAAPSRTGGFRKGDLDAFRRCADTIADQPGGNLALMAIFSFVQNVLAKPSDPERRLISLLAPTFTSCVSPCARGLEALLASGFTSAHQAADGTPYLFMAQADLELLRALDVELRARLRLPDGEVPPGFLQSQLTCARATNLQSLRTVLEGLRTSPNGTRAIRTMLGYVRAVKARPFDPRYRLVHIFNRRFLDGIGAVPRGLEAMRALGFGALLHGQEGAGPFLFMQVVDLEVLAHAEAALLDELPRALAYDRMFGEGPQPKPRPQGAARGNEPPPGPASRLPRPVKRTATRARASVQWQADQSADGEEEDDEAGGASGGGPAAPASSPSSSGGLGSAGSLALLPPTDLLLRKVLAYLLFAIESVVKVGLLRPPPDFLAQQQGGPPRFPAQNMTAAASANASGVALPQHLPGFPVPGLPPNYRYVPVGAHELAQLFGSSAAARANGSAGTGAEAEEQPETELSLLEGRLRRAALSTEAREVATRELQRLRRMSPQHSDFSATFDYLDWICETPWLPAPGASVANVSLARARAQLESEHCGLPRVKRRILEHLAVAKLTSEGRGTILCLLGPPGVGKTSLGQSIATSLGRKFQRISLGGVHSESEIRGHRRTYVGALPGLLVQALRKAGTNNPVIMLDELDKLGTRSLHGDPSSAMLEVLDPEQNGAFRDHFLNVPFNLSRVLFIATANEQDNIARPLLDRLELVELSGYTIDEKVRIARAHLLPKQLLRHGLRPDELVVSEALLELIASRYTREAGVRELERMLAALCRSVAAEVAEELPDDGAVRAEASPDASRATELRADSAVDSAGKVRRSPRAPRRGKPPEAQLEADGCKPAASGEQAAPSAPDEAAGRPLRAPVILNATRCRQILGEDKYESEVAQRLNVSGVAMGLAYTASGGELLFIEANRMPGSGKLVLTGRLGEVMKESATTALSYLRAHAFELGLVRSAGEDVLNSSDVHLHFPAGGIPKDGPSAGVTIVSALVSLLGTRLCRSDTAMTGEITLRGLVLPVGGIREKVIAAHRAGLRRVVLPERNRKDLSELPANVLADIEFAFVKDIGGVLRNTLLGADQPSGTRLEQPLDPGAGVVVTDELVPSSMTFLQS